MGLVIGSIAFKKLISKKLLTFQTNGSEIIAHPIMNTKMGIESEWKPWSRIIFFNWFSFSEKKERKR